MKNFLNISTALLIITSAFAQAPDSVLRELPDQRTYFSKTYYNTSDNTYVSRISAGYVHYLASDGRFKNINTNLRLDERGAYYIIDTGLYNVAFAAAIGQGNWDVAYEVPRPVHQKFRDPGKPAPVTRLRWKVLSYGYFDQSRNQYQIIDYGKTVAPVVAANTINYPKIFAGIDIRYACDNMRLKEEIVLSPAARKTLPDPTRYSLSRSNSYFVVAMEFLLTPNNTKVLANRAAGKVPIDVNKSLAFNGDEPIDFEDETGVVPFFFEKDYAHAMADSVTDFANRVSVKRVFYTENGKQYLLVGVPWSWLNAAPAGEIVIDPSTSAAASDDVRLYDGSNYGTSTILAVGKFPSGGFKARTLIKFNLSGIPSGATVLRSTMNLSYYEAVNFGGGTWVDRWIEARQVKKNWNELQATKDKRVTSPDTSWLATYGALDGTDVASTYESRILFWQNEALPKWKLLDLTALTQKWLNSTAPNYGVMLRATNEDTAGYAMRFYSSEASPAFYQPYLEVVYSTEAAIKTVYFLKDHLGSIRATVLDSAGAPVIGYDDYDPWGYPLALRAKPIPNAYLQGASKNKFTGKERDDEFGLNLDYFGGRYYDWLRGQWISRDPLAEKYPSWSPYNYALNNPLKYVDRDGRDVVILNDPQGAYGFGHNAILIGNDNKGWIYYSRDGRADDGSSKYTRQEFKTFDGFTDSKLSRRYDEAVRFQTTDEQDKAGQEYAEKAVKKEFDRTDCNCADLAKESAAKADVKVKGDKSFGVTVPNKQILRAKELAKKTENAKVIDLNEERRKKDAENKTTEGDQPNN